MPASSCRRNSSTRRSSSSRTSTSPSARSTSPCPGFMRSSLTVWAIMAKAEPAGPLGPRGPASGPAPRGPGRAARAAAPLTVAARPSTSTGPAPAPELPQAVADRPAGRPRAIRAASSGVVAERQRAASVEECVQPEPCAAPSGWRSPGISTSRCAVEEQVAALLAVAAGDDDDLRAERVHRAGELRGRSSSSSSPASARASGRFGVATVARGTSRSTSAACASGVEQARRRTRRPSPGRPPPACPPPAAASASATASIAGTAPTIPIFTASIPRSSATARTWATIMRGLTGSTAVTATVFCAVIAVIAVVPCTPAAANALRSAWMPAPPPESEPAMDEARQGCAAASARRQSIGSRPGGELKRSRACPADVAPARHPAQRPEQLELREPGHDLRDVDRMARQRRRPCRARRPRRRAAAGGGARAAAVVRRRPPPAAAAPRPPRRGPRPGRRARRGPASAPSRSSALVPAARARRDRSGDGADLAARGRRRTRR